MKRITIKDIAKKAGVNHTTVSRVIHNDPSISRATKEKINRIIRQMNYFPNTAARSLVRGKTSTIAFAAPFITSQGELDIITGIGDRLKETNSAYDITFYTTRYATGTKEQTLRGILYGRKADGLIITSMSVEEAIVQEFRKNGFPLVILEDNIPGAHSIMTNSYRGGFMATEYLAGRGKKKIAYVAGGRIHNYNLGTIQNYDGERYRGYRAALEKNGLRFRENAVVRIDNSFATEGMSAFSRLMAAEPGIDGIFCAAGDVVAAGMIRQALMQGVSIPGEVAIVGYDNNYIAEFLNPGITTVTNHHRQMGAAAFDLIMEEISKGVQEPRQIKFEPEIVVRASA